MNRNIALAALVVVSLGVAYAEDKVQKESGSARAQFSWDKPDLDPNRLARTVEGAGVGGCEVDSGTVWVSFDPERTSAATILQKFKDTRAYDTAKLTTVVATFKGAWGVVTASATARGAKGSAKRRGELTVRVDGVAGTTVDMDAKTAKAHGKFKPGIVIKAPKEVDMDKAMGKVEHTGSGETYTQGLSLKKGGEDSVINLTVNVVAKDSAGKESLHAVELPVPVLATN
ncbi:MAG: hypothetical protein ACAI25_19280 [Planctomycetota bacterium]